jgi:hypothetical protein
VCEGTRGITLSHHHSSVRLIARRAHANPLGDLPLLLLLLHLVAVQLRTPRQHLLHCVRTQVVHRYTGALAETRAAASCEHLNIPSLVREA